MDIKYMMHQAGIVRYSTTAGTNTIIQKKGPKTGLLVTKSFERSLCDSTNESKLFGFVSKDMVVGIKIIKKTRKGGKKHVLSKTIYKRVSFFNRCSSFSDGSVVCRTNAPC